MVDEKNGFNPHVRQVLASSLDHPCLALGSGGLVLYKSGFAVIEEGLLCQSRLELFVVLKSDKVDEIRHQLDLFTHSPSAPDKVELCTSHGGSCDTSKAFLAVYEV